MWGQFAAMVGGAAAGLSSLVFLVVAFRFDTIATSIEYRSRAAQVLVVFVTTMVAAALVAVPQHPRLLGVELMAGAGTAGVLLIVLDRSARAAQQTARRWPAAVGMLVTLVALAGAGVLLAAGNDAGWYAYATAAVAALIFGVTGAWVFLTRAGLTSGSSGR
jgi:uncharacterized PurR-regulated membrane protein YhhQ (DUF165 family)